MAIAATGQAMGCANAEVALDEADVARPRGTLRDLASKRGLLVGAAFANHAFRRDPEYGEILGREFNCLVGENNMKMDAVQVQRGRFNFERADEMMEFAARHDMKVRAIPLAWHDGLPKWAMDKKFPRQEALDILREHVFTVMGRYKGRIFAWDVLNEGIDDRGPGLRKKGPWYHSIGPDYVEKVYQWAHEADPEALLFYNDFYIEGKTKKAGWCYEWIKEQLARGVPIQGIGLQYHVQARTPPPRADVIENMKRFSDLGLIVHITELDVWVPMKCTEEDLQQQARTYQDIFEIALSKPGCPAVVLWGFTDRYSWVPWTTGKRFGHALIYDKDYRPKPAYEAIRSVLREG
jgi:endo-1,4-beta-xylanase